MSGHLDHLADVRETRDAMHSLFGTRDATPAEPELPELQELPVTGPGFYDIPADQYHADPCPEPSLSASFACKLVSTTPAHAKLQHPRLNGAVDAAPDADQQTETTDTGVAAHAVFLEGRDVAEILPFPDWRTKAARAARDAARAAGKIPILAHRWTEVEAMLRTTRASLNRREDGAAMFTDGIPELTMIWTEDGLWFRARIDWLRLSVRMRQFAIDDYKTTTRTADPGHLSRQHVWDYGWDIQASFYRRGLLNLTGFGAEFRFAVQETHAPYALAVMAPDPAAEMLGDMRVQSAITLWRDGVHGGHWPDYPRQTAFFGVPTWLERQWADREVRDAV